MAATAEQILELVAEYAAERHAPKGFDPAAPSVPVSGRVFGEPFHHASRPSSQ